MTIANDFADEQSRPTLQARLTWGIAGIDRSGTSRFRPESLGRAVLDESFDLRKKEAQQHILDACEALGNDTQLVTSSSSSMSTSQKAEAVDCWVADYKQWRTQHVGDENGLKTFDTQRQLQAVQTIRADAGDRAVQGARCSCVYGDSVRDSQPNRFDGQVDAAGVRRVERGNAARERAGARNGSHSNRNGRIRGRRGGGDQRVVVDAEPGGAGGVDVHRDRHHAGGGVCGAGGVHAELGDCADGDGVHWRDCGHAAGGDLRAGVGAGHDGDDRVCGAADRDGGAERGVVAGAVPGGAAGGGAAARGGVAAGGGARGARTVWWRAGRR
ncbi:proline-rich receptor-like protein kinase PERK9 [Gracilaria domingensis]|nr:proline-rich receptor-like protein kinase PERK9 [Gracilaria domingensis]